MKIESIKNYSFSTLTLNTDIRINIEQFLKHETYYVPQKGNEATINKVNQTLDNALCSTFNIIT